MIVSIEGEKERERLAMAAFTMHFSLFLPLSSSLTASVLREFVSTSVLQFAVVVVCGVSDYPVAAISVITQNM